eukprot:c19988_g3_i3.p1 GENE.c19988_g3_i3~~c19988_g3_i3.p1  ORF type:complete len:112 (-),score=10.69 c19988_g3_i3:324-659(-)
MQPSSPFLLDSSKNIRWGIVLEFVICTEGWLRPISEMNLPQPSVQVRFEPRDISLRSIKHSPRAGMENISKGIVPEMRVRRRRYKCCVFVKSSILSWYFSGPVTMKVHMQQ